MVDIFVAPKNEAEAITEAATPLAPEPRGGSLSAFLVYPENVRFQTQQDDEQIIFLLRKHWITNISWIVFVLILIALPFLFLPILRQSIFISSLPDSYVLIGFLGWYLVVFGFSLVKFLVWYFNIYLVTDERIVDVDFYNLLYKKLSSCRISKIQDVTFKLGGVIRSLFDFGDIFIQTAGTENNFEFEAVPHPEEVVRKIGDLSEHFEVKTYEK